MGSVHNNKRSKLICVLITFFIFISGMYVESFDFDTFNVDSMFVCAHTETEYSNISSVKAVVKDVHACTTEMLGIRDNTRLGQLTFRFTNQKKYSRIFPGLLCENVIALNDGKYHASFEQIQFVSINQDLIVTTYIHKSDGKKRT